MLIEAKKRRKNFISITPLIDVVFILLLFFMLTSTFSKMKQIEMKTPLLGKNSINNDKNEIEKFLLLNEDTILVNNIKYKISNNEFNNLLQKYILNKKKIDISTTKEINIQNLISFIDYINLMGISNINLAKSEKYDVD